MPRTSPSRSPQSRRGQARPRGTKAILQGRTLRQECFGANGTVAQLRVGRIKQRPEPARLSELSAVWRLGMTCFSDSALPYAVLGPYLTGRDSTILIVRQQLGVAGFAVLRLARDRGRLMGVIVSLGVDPTHREQGIGRRLLRESCRWCRQAGAERLRLEVAQDNVPALALYRSQGYRAVAILPHYYGVERDGLRMERSVLPRGATVESLKGGPAGDMIPTTW